jgi:hypothetical protein
MQATRPLRTIRFCRTVGLLAWLSPAIIQVSAPAQSDTTSIQVPAVSAPSDPIAIVPLDSRVPGSAAVVTGALQVSQGKAIIASNGTVTSGATTTVVALPRRGTLNICTATTIKLASDSGVPSGDAPGLMMAMDHGAIETSFAAGKNADMLLTPDFRILIGGPGAINVKIRLGQGGDTCVDNPRGSGEGAPYVLVTSVFDGRLYRVQPGQRVMFQHGSMDAVVDQEKEPCGCPPAPAETQGNDFPLAQSEGLAPTAAPKPAAAPRKGKATQAPPLVYNAGESNPTVASLPGQADGTTAPAQTAKRKKPGLFARIGHLFRRIFGAE